MKLRDRAGEIPLHAVTAVIQTASAPIGRLRHAEPSVVAIAAVNIAEIIIVEPGGSRVQAIPERDIGKFADDEIFRSALPAETVVAIARNIFQRTNFPASVAFEGDDAVSRIKHDFFFADPEQIRTVFQVGKINRPGFRSVVFPPADNRLQPFARRAEAFDAGRTFAGAMRGQREIQQIGRIAFLRVQSGSLRGDRINPPQETKRKGIDSPPAGVERSHDITGTVHRQPLREQRIAPQGLIDFQAVLEIVIVEEVTTADDGLRRHGQAYSPSH